MMRRFVLRQGVPLAVIAIAGCLGDGRPGDDQGTTDGGSDGDSKTTAKGDGGEETDDSTTGEDGMGNETDNEQRGTDIETRFEVLDTDTGILEGSADVQLEDETVIVTGAILGSNTCYTARLGTVAVADRTLLVGVESYEDVGEDEGCYDAIVGIEYEATIEIEGEHPEEVRVEHDGEHVTTTQSS